MEHSRPEPTQDELIELLHQMLNQAEKASTQPVHLPEEQPSSA